MRKLPYVLLEPGMMNGMDAARLMSEHEYHYECSYHYLCTTYTCALGAAYSAYKL